MKNEKIGSMEISHSGASKIDRYGWTVKDDPGTLLMLDKKSLVVNHEYQRTENESKVLALASSWSWVACGAIIVAERDNQYFVIDGQHRVMAAKRRSDISKLPCIVFYVLDISTEASGFIAANTFRKPVSAVDKFKALVVSGDETAIAVDSVIRELRIHVSSTSHGATGSLKSIGWCLKKAAINLESFREVLSVVRDIAVADGMYIPERVLESLWVINEKIGLDDPRLRQRVYAKGCRTLFDAANRAAAYYNSGGGGSVWATGVLDELNKGLQRKFSLSGDAT